MARCEPQGRRSDGEDKRTGASRFLAGSLQLGRQRGSAAILAAWMAGWKLAQPRTDSASRRRQNVAALERSDNVANSRRAVITQESEMHPLCPRGAAGADFAQLGDRSGIKRRDQAEFTGAPLGSGSLRRRASACDGRKISISAACPPPFWPVTKKPRGLGGAKLPTTRPGN